VIRISNAAIVAKQAAPEMCFESEVWLQLTPMQYELKRL
jgi:hypothetical protein